MTAAAEPTLTSRTLRDDLEAYLARTGSSWPELASRLCISTAELDAIGRHTAIRGEFHYMADLQWVTAVEGTTCDPDQLAQLLWDAYATEITP